MSMRHAAVNAAACNLAGRLLCPHVGLLVRSAARAPAPTSAEADPSGAAAGEQREQVQALQAKVAGLGSRAEAAQQQLQQAEHARQQEQQAALEAQVLQRR